MSRDRISRDEMFMQICEIVAQRSTCLRSQVGALIVKDGRIVSMGYNGPVSGIPPCVGVRQDMMGWELEDRVCMGAGCTRSLHAETNAIAFAARSGVAVEGCTLYCSYSPCINCAKVIVNSGIKELVFQHLYRGEEGLKLLDRAGIKLRHLRGG